MTRFKTEGGPLIIGSASQLERWRGASGGSGETTLTYGGVGWEKLPRHLRPKKAGKHELTFDTAEEAEAVAAEVTKHFLAMTPKAARLPKFPQHTFWYLDGKRVFGFEVGNTSDLSVAFAATKKGAAVKGALLFFPVEPGEVRVEASEKQVVFTTDAAEPTRKLKKLSQALVHDGGELWVFPAGLATAQVKRGKDGALLVPNQASPGGAVVPVSAKKLVAHTSEGMLTLSAAAPTR